MTQRLRIAVSVFFAVACVALCVLWARSYWTFDLIVGPAPGARSFEVYSYSGRVCVANVPPGSPPIHHWQLITATVDDSDIYAWKTTNATDAFQLMTFEAYRIFLPYWSLVLFASACAGLPWFPYASRFSLRTMLLATTLVAVVLGLVCYFLR